MEMNNIIEINSTTNAFFDRYFWCSEQFGELFDNDRWSYTIGEGFNSFLFENEEDAVLFALRWK
jgi:hypothetical protein